MEEVRGMVLIVDDEEAIRSILSRKLKAEGYSCETAADGKEALRKTSGKEFDLVLMDIKMPGLSGMEVLPRLVADHPDTGVLMLTAIVDTKTAVEAMKQGAYDYVTKPFDLDDLGLRVKRALERRRLVLENKEYQRRLEQRVEQQVGQIQQYYQEAVQALSREQIAIEELQVVRRSQQGRSVPSKDISARSSESLSSVKDFAKKLSKLFDVPAPASSGKGIAVATVLTDETSEEVCEQIPPEQEEKGSSVLYNGILELAILPPLNLQQMLQLHEHLRPFSQVKILNLGGSIDKGITIRLQLNTPITLIKMLRELPEVEKAVDESEVAGSLVPARQGEAQPVKRILVGLYKKSSAEADRGDTAV